MKKSLLIVFLFSILLVVGCTQAQYSDVKTFQLPWDKKEPKVDVTPKTVILECGDVITENTILGNNLINCPQHGLIINADNVTLDCNEHMIDGDSNTDTWGIVLSGVNDVTIKNCNAQEFRAGVYLISSYNNTITKNTLNNNDHYGVFIDNSHHNEISDNIANHNGRYGIFPYSDSTYNDIINNVVKNNQYGIYVAYRTAYNNIKGNRISENIEYGIMANIDSHDNIIWDNYFGGNGISNAHETSNSLNNNWDYNNKGNYWSDFNRNPGYPVSYIIPGDGEGVDNYPEGPLRKLTKQKPKML